MEAAVLSTRILIWPVLQRNMQVELRRAFLPVTHDLLPCFAPWHLVGTILRWHIGNDWLAGHEIQRAARIGGGGGGWAQLRDKRLGGCTGK